MLPLIENIPVVLAGTTDRNAEHQLLRGKVRYIRSWFPDDKDSSVFDQGVRILDCP